MFNLNALHLSSSLLLLFLFSHYFSPTFCEPSPQLTQPYNVAELYPKWANRVFSISTESPTAKAITRNETAQKLLVPLYMYFNNFSSLVEKRKANKHRNACNFHDNQWIARNVRNMILFQYGLLDQSCSSFIQASAAVQSGEIHASLLQNAREFIYNGMEAVYVAGSNIPQFPDPTNLSLHWTSGGLPSRSWDFTRNSQHCMVSNVMFMQKNGISHLQSFIDNIDSAIWADKCGRQTIMEFMRQDMNASARSILPQNGDVDQMENSSTFVFKKDGNPRNEDSPGHVEFDDPSSPLGRVFRLNQVAIDLASDAVTISNIAILALPMVMSIVPLALLADVKGWAMVCYFIFTDVFSALPLLIKGGELIHTGRTLEDIVIYHVGNSTFSVLEIFGVECRGVPKFKALGIVFIIVSLMGILIGLSLEVLAMWYVGKWEKEAEKRFGWRMFNVVSYGFLGAEDEPETVMKQYMYDKMMEAREEEMVLKLKENEEDARDFRWPWRFGMWWK